MCNEAQCDENDMIIINNYIAVMTCVEQRPTTILFSLSILLGKEHTHTPTSGLRSYIIFIVTLEEGYVLLLMCFFNFYTMLLCSPGVWIPILLRIKIYLPWK